jgi:hypothetical protein
MVAVPGSAAEEIDYCLWCGTSFAQPARRRGDPKKFCCSQHRSLFWRAARRWVANAVLLGLITADAIRSGGGGVHASRIANKSSLSSAVLAEGSE